MAGASWRFGARPSLLRLLAKACDADTVRAFPGLRQMKTEKLEVYRLAARRGESQGRALRSKDGHNLLREGPSVRFAVIAKHRGSWPLTRMCEALGVSLCGSFAWLPRSQGEHAKSDAALGPIDCGSFECSDRTYGASRVWRDVLTKGFSCRLQLVGRLMRAYAPRAELRRLRRVQRRQRGERVDPARRRRHHRRRRAEQAHVVRWRQPALHARRVPRRVRARELRRRRRHLLGTARVRTSAAHHRRRRWGHHDARRREGLRRRVQVGRRRRRHRDARGARLRRRLAWRRVGRRARGGARGALRPRAVTPRGSARSAAPRGSRTARTGDRSLRTAAAWLAWSASAGLQGLAGRPRRRHDRRAGEWHRPHADASRGGLRRALRRVAVPGHVRGELVVAGVRAPVNLGPERRAVQGDGNHNCLLRAELVISMDLLRRARLRYHYILDALDAQIISHVVVEERRLLDQSDDCVSKRGRRQQVPSPPIVLEDACRVVRCLSEGLPQRVYI